MFRYENRAPLKYNHQNSKCIETFIYYYINGTINNVHCLLIIFQEKDTLSFLVTIKDRVSASGGDSENDNLVEVPIRVIVLDENDNAPEFQNVSVPVGLDKSIHCTDSLGEVGGVSCLHFSLKCPAKLSCALDILLTPAPSNT